MLTLRKETPGDYEAVEALTRRAFYNVYAPGCIEHYILRQMRTHPDYLPELSFVLEDGPRLIGSIHYTRAWLAGKPGKPGLPVERIQAVTFGPISVEPELQRQGHGKRLLRHTLDLAAALDYGAAVVFGNPDHYVSVGFRSCQHYNVCQPDGRFPSAMLVRELQIDTLTGDPFVYFGSPALEVDGGEAEAYDASLPPMKKGWLPTQETFDILSHSFLE